VIKTMPTRSLPESARPKVVVIGAGFGGLAVVQGLARASVEVTVVDRRNHHLFQPLLYQVATAGLSGSDIAVPVRQILRRQRNARVLLAEARGFDLDRREVRLDCGVISYDWLVVATGAVNHWFGRDEWRPHAPGLKTLADAFTIRKRVLGAFEAAERAGSEAERAAWLTFVVIGGGPTGVELAGALAEIARQTLTRDFRSFDPRAAKVLLLEGADRVLGTFDPALSEHAARQLRELGVDVRTRSLVTLIDGNCVELGEERIETRTVLWAAGVRASPLGKVLGGPVDDTHRVCVDEFLALPEHPEVLVIGDLARVEQDGQIVPGVAPAATQMGRYAARSIRARLKGDNVAPFRYQDKGSMATIGRSKAVAQVGSLKISGMLAWQMWTWIHVFFLVGFRNRYLVMVNWAWSWLTWQRGSRVVLTDAVDPYGRSLLSDGHGEGSGAGPGDGDSG
jgi:NADH dehydrogenase